MKIIDLNGTWKLESAYLKQPIAVTVPGSVYHDLLSVGLIADPFVADNEWQTREIMRYDFVYSRTFVADLNDLSNPFLVMEGLDTVASVYLNDLLIHKSFNMHRTYRVSINDYLVAGENRLKIVLHSPINHIEAEASKFNRELYHARYSLKGYIYLRKAHSMLGWDWGPQLPDAGIWRNIYIESHKFARIVSLKIDQTHTKETVNLCIEPEIEIYRHPLNAAVEIEICDPESRKIHLGRIDLDVAVIASVKIASPQLWFPSGYGRQPLYTIRATIVAEGEIDDEFSQTIGLRAVEVIRQKDEFGESFTFAVNGIKIFAKGANYIIEDNLLPRQTEHTTYDLLKSAVACNHNMIRVWGGGIYPPDYFFEICDKIGLLVWQDLMFACSVYELTDSFIDEIHHEIRDNLIRIRHHPCLALICGNNENEEAVANWNVPSLAYSQASYRRQYDDLIPAWVKEYAPSLFYWPSSPSSGTTFQNPNSDQFGDMHYWGVWHNTEPITNYRCFFPRFMSEFGLQSFPGLETVKSFAEAKDFNIFSRIMEHHQKNSTANSKILLYIGMMFRYPKDFSSLLYVSQLIQAEGIRYGVEHMRRNYGRCMGSLYWQLNDCWPVASWSSIDYFHRWKALHYHSRKFYQPILLSLEEANTNVSFHVTNDTLNDCIGTVVWSLMTFGGDIIDSGSIPVSVSSQSSVNCATIAYELSDHNKQRTVIVANLVLEDEVVASNLVSFVPDKHLELELPLIKVKLASGQNGYRLELESDKFAKFVEISINDADVVFSDNYFHLVPKQKHVIYFDCEKSLSLEDVKLRSLVNSHC